MNEDVLNNLEKLWDPIPIKDVSFRVQSVYKGGYATIIAYKNARIDMKRLDTLFPGQWRKEYKEVGGKIFCGIGIRIYPEDSTDKYEWRWDIGSSEGEISPEKAQASDSFKRAAFSWGIGRELYDYPMINLKLRDDEYLMTGERYRPTYSLKLKEWRWDVKYDEHNTVNHLEAFDERGALRYSFDKAAVASNAQAPTRPLEQSNGHNPQSPIQNPQSQSPAPKSKAKRILREFEADGQSHTEDFERVVRGIDSGQITTIDYILERRAVSSELQKKLELMISGAKKLNAFG